MQASQVKNSDILREAGTDREIKTQLILNRCFAITAAATKDARATARTIVCASHFSACVEKAVTQTVSHLKREFSPTWQIKLTHTHTPYLR